jgi:uncharacterized repeat protein (TIGR01451 family)
MCSTASRFRSARLLVASALALVSAAMCLPASGLAAQPPVDLGTAGSFAVLGGSTVTNTGPSVLNGDLGVSPGAAITGFPPGLVNGATHSADAVAGQAQTDVTTAYNDAAGRTPFTVNPPDIGGQTLPAGVYQSATSLGLTGDVTLDAAGDPGAVFIFQAGSTLTTASGSRVLLINGASPCNVFWQVGSSATFGTSTTFNGNVLALTSISATTGANFTGRLLARNGAVTLDTNVVTRSPCTADIQVVKTGPATVAAGGQLTWTVSTTNNGPGAATGVSVADTLPAGTTFVSASAGCTAASGTVTCDIGNLASGATATRQITVSVPTGLAGTTLVNTATGSADQTDDTPGNNTGTATTTVVTVAPTDFNLTIRKTALDTTPELNVPFSYAIDVTNSGPATARQVVVTDTVPSALTILSATVPGGTCTISAQKVRCTIATIAAGATVRATIRVRPIRAGTVTNTAAVTSTPADRTPTDNTSQTTTPVLAPRTGMGIRKTASTHTARPGSHVRFTITITNTGSHAASGLQVCDRLPDGLSYVSAEGARVRGDLACWKLGLLAAHASKRFRVVARVDRGAPSRTVSNRATVRALNAAPKTVSTQVRIPPPRVVRPPNFTG